MFHVVFYPKPKLLTDLTNLIAAVAAKCISQSACLIFKVHFTKCLSHLTQLRVGLSKLNFHKFQHNFRDTINRMCPSNDGIEDTEHFLLLCPSFGVQRTDLLAGICSLVRPYGYVNLANDVLLQILLYGDKNFPNNLNGSILELTIRFIHSTGRFE